MTAKGKPSSAAPGKGGPPDSGRTYPRVGTEVGLVIGEKRLGVAAVPYLFPSLRDLEAEALADLGGVENVAALRREVLALGLHADSLVLALLAEIDAKCEQSRKRGRTPFPSRYKATAVIATFMDQAARRFREVGLARVAKRVDLQEYLRQRAGAPQEREDLAPESTPTDPLDAVLEATGASVTDTAAETTAPGTMTGTTGKPTAPGTMTESQGVGGATSSNLRDSDAPCDADVTRRDERDDEETAGGPRWTTPR